MGHLKICCAAS